MKEYHKTLCFDFLSEAYYQECLSNPDQFKSHLNQLNQVYPELFPKDFSFGWKLNGFTRVSKKKWIDNAAYNDKVRFRGISGTPIIYDALQYR